MRTPYIKISYFGFNFDWKSTYYFHDRTEFCLKTLSAAHTLGKPCLHSLKAYKRFHKNEIEEDASVLKALSEKFFACCI